MAKDDQLSLLLQGSIVWNEWRRYNLKIGRADLRDANLSGANLSGARLDRADLSGADLSSADLSMAFLSGANLRDANLEEADLDDTNLEEADLSNASLSEANLSEANLNAANLSGANLGGAYLIGANLSGARLDGTNLNAAVFHETILADIDLTTTIGLDNSQHHGPSSIDFRTLSRSGNLPISFLRGCGLPDSLIEYLPSFRGDAIRFYSCFISYSSKDEKFATKLEADLQNAGVRCWFAPHHLPTGAKIWDAIDEAIRLRDKLLIILSEASIGSDWVEDEVNKACAEERDRKTTVLFPVRIDDFVLTTSEPWARKLRDQRHIGDFRQWESVAGYSKSLERLFRDLKTTRASSLCPPNTDVTLSAI